MSNRDFARKYGNKALGLGSKGQMRRALRRGDMTQEEYMKAMSDDYVTGPGGSSEPSAPVNDPTQQSIEDQSLYAYMRFDAEGNPLDHQGNPIGNVQVTPATSFSGPERNTGIIGSDGKPYTPGPGITSMEFMQPGMLSGNASQQAQMRGLDNNSITPLPIIKPTEIDADRWKFWDNPEMGAGIKYSADYEYEEGGEYDLSVAEIQAIMDAGGIVEFV